MNTTRKCVVLLVLVLSMFAAATLVMAQATNSVPGTGGSLETVDVTTLWNALIAALVPVAVAAIKKITPNIPKVFWPVMAVGLGVLANWVAAKAGAIPHSSWEIGALCGAAGVGLREIATQSFAASQTAVAKLTGKTPTPTSRRR